MWSRSGIGSALAFGMSAASSSAEPAIGSLVPTAISVGVWIDADLLARQHLPRAADAGGERPAVGFGLVGEGAEHAALRIGDVGERRRLQRLGDALRQAHAIDQVHAEPAQHDRAHPLRVLSARNAVIRAPIE